MRKLLAAIAIIVALFVYVMMVGAESFAVGKMTLAGKTIEFINQVVTVEGNASFSSTGAQGPMQAGTIRLDWIKAQSIKIEMIKSKSNKLTVQTAQALGGVTIKGKRADLVKDESGRQSVVARDINAASQTANMDMGQDKVVLLGNVVVRITEPGLADPVAVVTGDRVTISLKDNKIRVEGQSDRQAEITVTQKETEKSQPSQK